MFQSKFCLFFARVSENPFFLTRVVLIFWHVSRHNSVSVACCANFLPFSKASEEEILGAGSEPSEPEGVKTNSKEVKLSNSYRT